MTRPGRATVIATGSYLPEQELSNQQVIERYGLNTTDAWITERLGIRSRRWAAPDEQCSDLAVQAARQALAAAGLQPAQIDGIILAPGYGDRMYPATAPAIARKLNMRSVFAFDVQSACTGFLVALQTGSRLVADGSYRYILAIGADVGSRGVKYDPHDRTMGVIFGDGAGAAILARAESAGAAEDCGILADHLGTDGEQWEVAGTLIGGSECPITIESVQAGKHFAFMSGPGVKDNALRRFPEAIRGVCQQAGVALSEVDFFVAHQANKRILEAVFAELQIPLSKTYLTIEKYGNLGNPSVAVTLDEAVRQALIRKGNLVCLVGAGAGFTWGSMLMRWGYNH